MEKDELAAYVASLGNGDSYRVDALLKETPLETTQRVFFVGADGSRLGPFVRKLIQVDSGLGAGYEAVFAAQKAGVRFRYLPRIAACRREGPILVVVMEYVPGVPLSERVAGMVGADERLRFAARVFPEVCRAASELHQSLDVPLIHRDLKPSNALVGKNDAITLIDLGISRLYHSGAECDTTHFGTRSYAPPEQFGFGQTSVHSDVYSLGMVLFFCLTGREATAAERERGFAGCGLSPELAAVIARATQLDPAERFASVDELRRAFEGALGKGTLAEVPEGAALVPDAAAASVPASPKGRRALNILRNIVAGSSYVILIMGSITAFVEPTGQDVSLPTWYLAAEYLVIVPVFSTGLCYLMADRTWFRENVPFLADLSKGQERGLAAIAMVVSVIVLMVSAAILGPVG